MGPRGLCRPLDEKHGFPLNNPHLAPCKGRTKWQTIAGRLGRQAGRQAGQVGQEVGREKEVPGQTKMTSMVVSLGSFFTA